MDCHLVTAMLKDSHLVIQKETLKDFRMEKD
jgi:hypothetical protein